MLKVVNNPYSLTESPAALPEEAILECIDSMDQFFANTSATFAGYQTSLDLDYSALSKFLNYNINNAGDPFINSNYRINSRMVEQPVLQFFSEHFHLPRENYWGYVTSGGTEANIYGIHVARNVLELPGAGNGKARRPIAYFSEDTHYSIKKALDMLRVDSRLIRSNPAGQIDIEALMDAVLASDSSQRPVLLILNLGTSFRGAYDDVESILSRFEEHSITDFFIHIDAALGGLYLPFLEGAVDQNVPIFDFRLPINSIAVSGHKCIGTPVPCGVYMTLLDNMKYAGGRQIEYIGTMDTTLAGSRSGLSAILLWYAIAKRGRDGFKKRALHMLSMSEYAMEVIAAAGFHPCKSDLGLSVVFDRPPEWVVEKWSLSTQGDQAHIFTMSHVGREGLDRLAADLRLARSIATKAVAAVEGRRLNYLGFLKKVMLFSDFDEDQLRLVANIVYEETVEDRTEVCQEGTAGEDEMFILVDGRLEVVKKQEAGDHKSGYRVIALMQPPEVAGELQVLANLPRTATLRARGSTQLLVIRGTDFRSLLHEYPALSDKVIRMLANRLGDANR